MSSDFLGSLEQWESLLFVTSDAAINTLMPDFNAEILTQMFGDRLHVIPASEDAILATVELRQHLTEHSSWIRGVVIIGNYSDVPSRTVKCLDPDLLERLSSVSRGMRGEAGESGPNVDPDEWWVWSDDIYGSIDKVTLLPHFPVSRIPIIPGMIGDPYTLSESSTVYGLRGSEFAFVDVIHHEVLGGNGAMDQSPPVATGPPKTATGEQIQIKQVSDVDLAVDWLYLVLHHPNTATLKLTGTADTDLKWQPIATNRTIFEGTSQAPAVVFGGICWGAMLVDQMASTHFNFKGAPFKDFDASRSVPVSFVNKGTNAFVGFTTQHHIPVYPGSDATLPTLDELTLGAPLHHYFWVNISSGYAPAEALFLAKASVISSLDYETMSPLALAQTLKSVWSATCVGIGW